jgi:hypothetical protein
MRDDDRAKIIIIAKVRTEKAAQQRLANWPGTTKGERMNVCHQKFSQTHTINGKGPFFIVFFI